MAVTTSYSLLYAGKIGAALSGENASNVYFTIGKTLPWANDSAPPVANSSVRTYNEIWSNMIGGKRLTGNDVAIVTYRYNWESGVVYQQYDDNINDAVLRGENYNFYVVTEDWNVYKCISNNNGAASTVKPTSTLTSGTFTLADGYVWKYMYTVSSADRIRFTTDKYLAITLSPYVIAQAIPDQISSIKVENQGTSYTNNTWITISGDGISANAYPVVVNNKIDKVVVDSPGLGYTFAEATVHGIGSNASVRVILSPPGGHGSNPYDELGAAYIIFNPRIKGNEGGRVITESQYRQIAIIVNAHEYGSTTSYSNTTFNQTTILTVTGISADYQINEFVYQGTSPTTATFGAVVAKWDGANGQVYVTNTQGIPKNDSLRGVTSTARRFVTSITNPDLTPRTGQVLYIDNISPVIRSDDQTDSYQIILTI